LPFAFTEYLGPGVIVIKIECSDSALCFVTSGKCDNNSNRRNGKTPQLAGHCLWSEWEIP